MPKRKQTETQLANLQSPNAIKNRFPHEASKRREEAKKGAANRARNVSLAKLAQMIGDNPASDKNKAAMAKIGITDEYATNNSLIVASVYQQAVKGRIDAVEKWEKYISEQNEAEKKFDLPAKAIGKAFVDINRNIVPNKNYIFAGGRGGLKSSYISLKLIELIINNPSMHACVIRKIQSTLKDSVYAQIKWAIHTLEMDERFECKVSPLEIRYVKTGQTIYFRGCDDPLKLKSIKPEFGYIGIMWIEEEDQLSGEAEERSVAQSVLRGGSESYMFASYNPPKSKDSWVNRRAELDDNPNTVYHLSSYLDAPEEWLGQKFLDDADHLKAVNQDAYEHEYLGIPNGSGGNVFDNLELRKITDDEIAHFDRIFQGVDWGWMPDPFAFIRLHYDRTRETIYVLDEIYENKISNEQSAELIKKRGYNDAHITCDSAEPKSVADFRSSGLPAKAAVKGPGSVDYGMKWLQVRKIVIDRDRTPNAYREFVNYEYDRDKEGNICSGYPDENNHLIDAMRYALEQFYNRYGSRA